jgi:putative MATE family efflux protein
MQDMTRGPVRGHILRLSAFIAVTTAVQTLYFLADLYWVGRLGKEALAGVGMAGNLMFLVLALTQSLAVGATSLIAQAIGRRDREHAQLVFNQVLVLSLAVGAVFVIAGFALRDAYVQGLAADAATAAHARAFLGWFLPALALQFGLVSMGAALRGIGDVKIPTALQVGTVVINMVFTPTLMFGWGTGRPLGVAGAGLATFLAIVAGGLAYVAYFLRPRNQLRFRARDWPPRLALWGNILRIGLPAGGEFALTAVYLIFVYDVIQPFGSAAQAGFGVGARVMQALFMPAVAVAFATAPVMGQNFGARLGPRVRDAFADAARLVAAVMIVMTAVCQVAPAALIRAFNADAAVVARGAEYLRIISWNFVASGVVFVSSSGFQGIGHTLPALGSSALRLVVFAVPTYLFALRPSFQLRHVWAWSVITVVMHMALNLWLLRREMDRRLPRAVAPRAEPLAAAGS